MDTDNLDLFKSALSTAVSNQKDAVVNSSPDIKLTADSVNYLALKLNTLIDDAIKLYWSDEPISEELAEALGTMWERCSDYIAMYEGSSRM